MLIWLSLITIQIEAKVELEKIIIGKLHLLL